MLRGGGSQFCTFTRRAWRPGSALSCDFLVRAIFSVGILAELTKSHGALIRSLYFFFFFFFGILFFFRSCISFLERYIYACPCCTPGSFSPIKKKRVTPTCVLSIDSFPARRGQTVGPRQGAGREGTHARCSSRVPYHFAVKYKKRQKKKDTVIYVRTCMYIVYFLKFHRYMLSAHASDTPPYWLPPLPFILFYISLCF